MKLFSPKELRTRATSGVRMVISFTAAIVVTFALWLLNVYCIEKYIDYQGQIRHSDEIVLSVKNIRRVISEAQMSERGYVLTGNQKYLTLYRQSIEDSDKYVNQLGKLLESDFKQMERFRSIRPRINEVLTLVSENVALREEGHATTSVNRDKLSEVKVIADETRSLLQEIEDAELGDVRGDIQAAQFAADFLRQALTVGFLLSLVMLSFALWLVVKNLKARNQAEGELHRFFENSADLFCVLGFDSKLTRVNPSFERALGFRSSDLVNKSLLDLVPKSEVDEINNEFVRLESGVDDIHFECRLITATGTEKWFSWKAIADQKEKHAFAVARDITDRKAQEEERMLARKAAQEANEAKSQFLANMSHEIRTPIGGVIGMANLLMGTHLDHEQKDQVQSILVSAQSLLYIVNDILDFSKIEAKKMSLEIVEFDLNSLLKDVERNFAFAVSQKSIQLVVHPIHMSHQLVGDPTRLQQVLFNLIGNAIKFTDRGKVDVRISMLKDMENEVRLRFDVSDTGVGIPQSSLQKLFEPFSQGDASTSRKFGGTGLGLSICKQIVGMMNGRIGVDSEESRGSTFWFELPFQKGQVVGSQIPRNNYDNSDAHFEGHILVAEDNQINQKVISQILKKVGCTYHIVGNGVEALAALKTFEFDLILMDCQMPEMDGFQATQQIRNSDNGKIRSLPIVAMTANAMKGDREKCLESGMDDYISKPIDNKKLFVILEQYLITPEGQSSSTSSIDETAIEKLEALQVPGEPDLVQDLIDTFQVSSTGKVLSLKDMFDSLDFESVRAEAHSLKSSARTIGATRLAQICEEIEHIPTSSFQDMFPSKYSQLNTELERASSHLEQILKRRLKAA